MDYAILNIRGGAFGFVANDDRLIATWLPQPEADARNIITMRWPDAVEQRNLLPRFQKQVRDYFNGRRVAFDVDIDLAAHPPFRQAVLEACRRIPYGKTASYADLARAVGRPGAARAVGGAMAHNPLPLVVPCHRVLGSDGSLGGFSSPRGIEEKERLLRLEGALREAGTRRGVNHPRAGRSREARRIRCTAGVA